MKWPQKKLGQVADFLLGKMLDEKKNKGEFRPYLANVNVRWGSFELGSLREMRFELHEHERYGLQFGDIVMCEGGEPGRCAIWKSQLPGMMFQKALHRIRPKADMDVRFLYYSFLNRGKNGGFDQYCTGSTIKHLPRQNLAMVEVDVPPLTIQKQIASILSAYDDLIENNTRRIEILEEMARRLYEEWFVQFRFPGHEGVEFKESELGLIPEGWGIQPLYDVAEVTYGHPFKASQFNEDGVGLGIVRIRDIKAGEVKTYTSEEGKPKHLIENGDILIGMDGQFHMGKWAGGQAWLVQRVARFRPIQVGRYFLFLSLERPIKHLENTIVGTTVAHLSAKDLQKLHVVVPEKAVLDAASAFLEPLYDLEMKLRRKNANLRAQRDLLIPKLISGEIDVSDIPMPT